MCKIVNPWYGISLKKTIAGCDEDYFIKNYGSPSGFVKYINSKYPKAGMTFDCLPEPFSGDINSQVYCLNKNPGEPVPAFHKDLGFEKLTQDNLSHKLTAPFWAQRGVLTKSGIIHGGVEWFEKRTKSLRDDLQHTPNLFFVDYFPYHSTHGFSFPKDLPSYEYRNYLVEEAMNANKIIIIMRQGKDWLSAIPKLRYYNRLITLHCPAGGWLSEKNFNYGPGVSYIDLIKVL